MSVCAECGKEIEGRTDKKFCSHYCKSNYHYVRNRGKENNRYKDIDLQLKLNRRILKEYNKGGKVTVRKSVLLTTGFNPKYFTHYWKNSKGQVYLFCYEYGYLQTVERNIEKYVLVQWQSYMD
jgi:predicted nucleic acid-binding Zn ribbon protein